jgi:hypothetical protein
MSCLGKQDLFSFGSFGLGRKSHGPNRNLIGLKARLAPTFAHKRALVIGSAPNLVLPPVDRYDTVICVNGSGRPAFDLGILQPDLTVVGGYSTRSDTDVRLKTRIAWRGLETNCLLFVVSGRAAWRGRRIIRSAGLRFDTFRTVSMEERAFITSEVCRENLFQGEREDRISMGVFAAIVALWSGADRVILAGFSLGGGHRYIEGDTPRYHLAGDARFFRSARALSLPVATNVPEIQREFDIWPV